MTRMSSDIGCTRPRLAAMLCFRLRHALLLRSDISRPRVSACALRNILSGGYVGGSWQAKADTYLAGKQGQ